MNHFHFPHRIPHSVQMNTVFGKTGIEVSIGIQKAGKNIDVRQCIVTGQGGNPGVERADVVVGGSDFLIWLFTGSTLCKKSSELGDLLRICATISR